jgi:hypothetical protein
MSVDVNTIKELSDKITDLIHPSRNIKINADPEEEAFWEEFYQLPPDPYDQNVIIYALIDVLARHIPADDNDRALRIAIKSLKDKVGRFKALLNKLTNHHRAPSSPARLRISRAGMTRTWSFTRCLNFSALFMARF